MIKYHWRGMVKVFGWRVTAMFLFHLLWTRLTGVLAHLPAVGAIYQVSIAAATAVVGYDLFQNTFWKTSGRRRLIRGLACRGSAAAGDTQIDIMVGEVTVSTLYNTTTGFPNMDDVFPAGNIPLPAGTPVSAIVRDAPATNPINVLIDLVG